MRVDLELGNFDDQIIAMLLDIQNRLSDLESRLRRVEGHAHRIRVDVGTVGD